MKPSPTTFNERYLSGRRDPRNSFGYGLLRRTSMVLTALDSHRFQPAREKFDVIDFGCADGTMLEAIATKMTSRFGSGLGLDVFRSGIPKASDDLQIHFQAVDLFKQFPFPIADSSRDIAIASAFLKHHPNPRRFLVEAIRILRPGGCLLLLDPRPFVVHVGQRFGRFNPEFNPSTWSKDTIEEIVATLPLEARPRIGAYTRYWIAPSYGLYRIGLERALPSPVKNLFALHQCLMLLK
jgi:SAM-dependent methyltransferase